MSLIDLNQPPPNHKFNVSVEREETDAERSVRLFKDVTLFLSALALVGVITWLCVTTLASGTAEEKRWAQSLLTALAGGLIGYLLKR